MYQDIPPGLRLQVTTWENDGDNYNTESMDGLSKDEVRFIIHVCKLFKCGDLGNEELHGEQFALKMQVHLTNFDGEIPEDWLPEDEDIDEAEALSDFYHDRLGDLGIHSTEYGYWRVFESAEVFEIPTTIKNVTKQFV